MCKCVLKQCSSCTNASRKWTECKELEKYRTMNQGATVDSSEWVDQHGALDPAKVVIEITGVTCPKCRGLNKGRASVTDLVAAFEEFTSPYAGTFVLMAADGTTPMKKWVKKVHQQYATETETDYDTDNDVLNQAKNLATNRVAFKA